MQDDALALDEVRKMAAEIGLDRLTEEHLQQLARAVAATRARRSALAGANVGPADEPAHVFRLLDIPVPPSSLSLLPEE